MTKESKLKYFHTLLSSKTKKDIYTMSSDSNEIELESTSEQKFGVWIDDKLN